MNTINKIPNNYSIQSNHNFLNVLVNNTTGQKSLHTNKPIKTNEIIEKFTAASILNTPNYLTIQIAINTHITLNPTHLQFINHSCSPTIFFDTKNYYLVALKDINIGEELTFFYPSTEWNIAAPFTCNCGSKNCLQTIVGAAHIAKEILTNYRLTSFIQSLI